MQTPKMADWGRWMNRFASRREQKAPPLPREILACERCGHALSLEVQVLPRCVCCGDGNPELALYSHHALRTAVSEEPSSAS